MGLFVYCPKSGDRVFAAAPAEGMVIVRYANKCRHIIGGVHLEWWTARPGAWWRADAKKLAAAIVAAVGGVAWDDNGVVHLVVPAGRAAHVRGLMTAASGEPEIDTERDARDAALLIAGYVPLPGELSVASSAYRPSTTPQAWTVEVSTPTETTFPGTVWMRSEDHLCVRLVAGDTCHSVSAPADWTIVEVLVPRAPEGEMV